MISDIKFDMRWNSKMIAHEKDMEEPYKGYC